MTVYQVMYLSNSPNSEAFCPKNSRIRSLETVLRWAIAFAVLLALGDRSLLAQSLSDWPFYRHDLQLSGRSPGKGKMRQAPVEKWRWYLGGDRNLFEVSPRPGVSEAELSRVEFGAAYEQESVSKWRPPVLVDLAGNGQLVPRPTGKVGKLLAEISGLQQVTFEFVPDKPNSARGRCFAFDRGVDQPRLVWETEVEGEVYEMLWALGDMDGDGQLEVVFMTHYRAIVYDGATGRKKSTLAWDIGRNYGLMELIDVDGDGAKEVAVVVDSPPHVDVLKYAPEQGKPLWTLRYVTDAQVLLPIDLRLYTIPNGVGDLDADGQIEIAYNLYNEKGDHRWHVIIRDALSGTVKVDLPSLFLYGVVDLGGPTKALCCSKAEGSGPPSDAEGALFDFRKGEWMSMWTGPRVRWQLAPHDGPVEFSSIASLGPTAAQVVRTTDVDGDGQSDLFATLDRSTAIALGRNAAGEFETKWRVVGPADSVLAIEGAQQTTCLLNVDATQGTLATTGCVTFAKSRSRRGDFGPAPARSLAMVADVDGDGANETIAQDSLGRTRVVRFSKDADCPKELLRVRGGGLALGTRWPGYPYTKYPAFTFDLDGDGRRELLLTDVDDETEATLFCRDHEGELRWRCALPGTPARGIVWIMPGHYVQPDRFDLFVVVQNGGLGEGFLLEGATGAIVWRRAELKIANGTPFNIGTNGPWLSAADADGDGLDDILGETDPYLLVLRGRDGEPRVTPRTMLGDLFQGFVVYGEAMVGDWDGSGRPSIFTNTPLGGFGLVTADLRVKWSRAIPDGRRNCIGSIGRVSPEGPWVYGTISNEEFQLYDLRNGEPLAAGAVGFDPGAYQALYSADIDDDGQDEFLAFAGDRLICVGLKKIAEGPGHRPILEWSLAVPGASGPLTIADVDHDGAIDILFTGSDGCVHVLVAQ